MAVPDSPDASERRHPKSLPADVEKIPWAAEQLRVSVATCYRMAQAGRMPGAFKVNADERGRGGQWRISVPKFHLEVHGDNGARMQAEACHEDAQVSS